MYIILFIFWKQLEKLLEEDDELSRHFVQLVKITIGVDITEAGSHGLIDEQHVGEFIPRTFIIFQRMVVLESVRTNLH